MSLIAGHELKPEVFFSGGAPKARASSFDLTIGTIFERDGKEVEGSFLLEPGAMVQVVSAERFNLPKTVTGHVTYKTDLTKRGIWALTIGIVDPGWTGPVTTTLLNFSQVPHVLVQGAPFLRVSLFRHSAAEDDTLPGPFKLDDYMRDAQEKAMTRFARTFLNQEQITKNAADQVFEGITARAIPWIAVIAVVFTLIQWLMDGSYRGSLLQANDEFGRMRTKIEELDSRLTKVEIEQAVPHSRDAAAPGKNHK